MEQYAVDALPPLIIAVKNLEHIARPLVKTLLQHGTSFTQTVKGSNESAFTFALSRGTKVFDLFAEHDS